MTRNGPRFRSPCGGVSSLRVLGVCCRRAGACLGVRREGRVGARHGGLRLKVQLRLRLRGLLRLHMRLQAWSSLTQHDFR